MKVIPLEQNTREWHKWRKQGVGSSDVACLLGLNPFKSRAEFLKQWLLGSGDCDAFADDCADPGIQRGRKLEAPAREELSRRLGLCFRPQCGEWDEDNFLRASFDGYDEKQKIICEIKAPRIYCGISDIHYFQVQAQLLVSGAKECLFCQVIEREGAPEITWEVFTPSAQAAERIKGAIADFKASIGNLTLSSLQLVNPSS